MRVFRSRSPLLRRLFLSISAFAVAVAAIAPLQAEMRPVHKSLKMNMVRIEGSLTDKFRVARDAGFKGIELDSPGLNVEEVKQAIAETGLPVDGTICRTHWQIRHTDPDPEVRAQALADLQNALRETHAIGGNTVLLVPGHGRDGTSEEVWDRAFKNINQAVPLAAELGVVIAIENVWNHFLYEHDGPADQSADEFVEFVDAFRSPWVGMQFDIGNHQKYGDPAEWIRTLGPRIVKLDVKDWGRESGWSPIGQGDVDWGNVREALAEIGFTGWAAAEVAGGDGDHLKMVSEQMDEAFGLR
ncbi:MAG TPA: sugar phosphate isomerase/epimerase family protein [Opitutales bacterium]|nr:sugar phosphate isomerase/epimerase family protein [Opitutales bacterium]